MSTTLELAPLTEVDPNLPIPCEHPDHTGDTLYHQGPGELYIKNLPCPSCGDKPREGFICCRRAYVMAGKMGLVCVRCLKPGSRADYWVLVREL